MTDACTCEMASEMETRLQVGNLYDSFEEVNRSIKQFEKKTFTQFYVRDSRTFKKAERTTPKVVEKANKRLQYTFVKYTCIHGGRSFKSRPTTGTRPQQM